MSTQAAPQLSIRAIALSIVLAIILAAANTYLGLFAGLTIASAIPAAVVSMAVLRFWRRPHPGKQHRADRRVGGGLDRGRCHLHDPRARHHRLLARLEIRVDAERSCNSKANIEVADDGEASVADSGSKALWSTVPRAATQNTKRRVTALPRRTILRCTSIIHVPPVWINWCPDPMPHRSWRSRCVDWSL